MSLDPWLITITKKEMRPRIILFIIGILVFLMGSLPLLSSLIPSASKFIGSMPKPGTLIYQVILTLFGILAIGYSIKKEEREVKVIKGR